MKPKVILIDIEILKPHEKIIESHLKEIMEQIQNDGFINNPIIVDRKTLIILDGHHRYNAAKKLGLSKVPACLVDYNSERITVMAFRSGEKITKDKVRIAGLSGKLFKPKTSKHFIPERPENVGIQLACLK